MPFRFWDEAIICACHLVNLLPTPVLNGKSPHELLFHSKPSCSNLIVFGCSCFSHRRPYSRHKFEFHSTPSAFIGYSTKFKCYKCVSNTGKIIYTRNVLFDKTSLPFENKTDFQTNAATHVDNALISSTAIVPQPINSAVYTLVPSPPTSSLSISSSSPLSYSNSSPIVSSDPVLPFPTPLHSSKPTYK